GTFSPQRPLLRLDGHGYSPAVLRQIVTAGARLHSFADAAFALSLTGLSISPRHVHELTGQVGAELAAPRDAKARQRLKRRRPPGVGAAPWAVAVEVDGGRLRARASGCGPGVQEPENKEDKLACLVTLRSQEHAADPQPEVPPSFVQPRRIQRLVRQMGGWAGEEAAAEAEAVPAAGEGPPGLPQAGAWGARGAVGAGPGRLGGQPGLRADGGRGGAGAGLLCRRAPGLRGRRPGVQLGDPARLLPGLRADRRLPARDLLLVLRGPGAGTGGVPALGPVRGVGARL